MLAFHYLLNFIIIQYLSSIWLLIFRANVIHQMNHFQFSVNKADFYVSIKLNWEISANSNDDAKWPI